MFGCPTALPSVAAGSAPSGVLSLEEPRTLKLDSDEVGFFPSEVLSLEEPRTLKEESFRLFAIVVNEAKNSFGGALDAECVVMLMQD